MGGQDCDGSTLPQAPIGSLPIRSDGLPCPSPTDDDRQISSEDRRSVKLRVRPPPAGTHQCHRATSAGSGMMLTVKLTRRGRDDLLMARSFIVQQAHVTSSHTRNERVLSERWCTARSKWRPTRKRFWTSPCTDKNRCACQADLNRRICRSRCRVGLVRDFGSVVFVLFGAVHDRQQDRAVGSRVAA